MGLMMEAFGWSADQFWHSTPHELWAVIEARQRMNEQLRDS